MKKDYFRTLTEFVKSEYSQYQIFPPGKLIFNAFNLCPFDKVKVVIIGQDPTTGQARHTDFVSQSMTEFLSLLHRVNIFKEIKADIGTDAPRYRKPDSLGRTRSIVAQRDSDRAALIRQAPHQNRGWEALQMLQSVPWQKKENILVFILWGAYAQTKGAFIDRKQTPGTQSPPILSSLCLTTASSKQTFQPDKRLPETHGKRNRNRMVGVVAWRCENGESE